MSRRGITLFQVLTGIIVLTAVGHVGVQLLRVGTLRAGIPVQGGAFLIGIITAYLIVHLTALGAAAIAAVLVVRVPERQDARALALFLAFLAHFWGSLFRFFSASLSADGNALHFSITFGPGSSALAYAALVLSIAAFLRFSVLFPRPLPSSVFDRKRRRVQPLKALRRILVDPRVVWAVAAVLISVFSVPWLNQTWAPAPGVGRWWEYLPSGDLKRVVSVLFIMLYVTIPLGLIVFGVQNLLSGVRALGGENRRKSLWVFAGFTVAMWMLVISIAILLLPSYLFDPVDMAVLLFLLSPTVIVISLTAGLFYRGDLDPALVIKKTTVYGVLGTLFLVLFAVVESVVSEILENRLGLPGLLGGAVAGGFVALIVLPFRHRLTGWVDRIGPRTGGASPDGL